MTLAAVESWEYVSGDAIDREFTVVDENGDVVDITGMTGRFAASRTATDAAVLSTADATATVTLTTPISGIFQVAIDGADTTGLLGTYRFQVELEDPSGDKFIVARGFVTFHPRLI